MPAPAPWWVSRPPLGQVIGTLPQYRGYTPQPSPSTIQFVQDERSGSSGGGGVGGDEGGPEAIGDLRNILDNIREGALSDLPQDSQDRIQQALEFLNRADVAVSDDTGPTDGAGRNRRVNDRTRVHNGEIQLRGEDGWEDFSYENATGSEGPLWAQALGLVDLPRSVAVSAVKEGLVDPLTGREASFDQFAEQARHHIGVGDIVEEQGGTGNIWADRAIGFAGDVALDPLSYLAPEAKLGVTGARGAARYLDDLAEIFTREGAQAGAERIAREVADEGAQAAASSVARRLGPEGIRDAARRARQRGISSLSDDELSLLGARGGVYLNVPGTGRVARGVRNTGRRVTNRARVAAGREAKAAFTYEPIQAQILGRSRALTAPLRGVGAGRARVSRSAAMEHLRGAFGGRLTGVKRTLATAGPDELDAWHAAQRTESLDRRFSLQRKLYEEQLEAEGHLLRSKARTHRINGRTIQSALGGNVDAVAKMEKRAPGLFADIRAWDDATRTRGNALAGEDYIPFRKDHAYAIRPDELRDYYRSIKRSPGRRRPKHDFDAAGFEQKANIVEGGEFMDEVLVSSSQHPRGLNPREQAQEIIEDRLREYGSKAFAMFEDDWFKVFPQQVRTMGRRSAARGMENALRAEDILKPIYKPTKKSLREIAHYERMRNGLDFLKSEVRRKSAGVEKLGERARAAARRADDLARKQRNVEGAGAARVRAAREATGQPSKRAAVQREYAEVLAEQHADVSAQVYALEQRQLRALTDSDLGAARAAADESYARVQATSGRLRSLQRYRDELRAKVVKAQTFGETVEAEANEIISLQRQLDIVDEDIDALQTEVAGLGRQPEQIRADIDAVTAKVSEYQGQVQKLERTLSTLRLAGGTWEGNQLGLQAADMMETLRRAGLTVNDLQEQLRKALRQVETGTRFNASLRAELNAAEGQFSTPAARNAAEDLETYRQMRTEMVDRLTELGQHDLAAQLARGLENTVEWTDKGFLVPVVNGTEGQWRHGGKFPMDLTRPLGAKTRNTAELDAYLGPIHLTANPEVAKNFENFSVERDEMLGVMDPGSLPSQQPTIGTAQFDVHAENPIVYFGDESWSARTMPRGSLGGRRVSTTDEGFDLQGSASYGGAAEDARSDLVGSGHTLGRSTLHEDMLEVGIGQGEVGIEELVQATVRSSDSLGFHVRHGITMEGMEDEARRIWAAVIEDWEAGASFHDAVGHHFAYSDFDFGMSTRLSRQQYTGMYSDVETMTPDEFIGHYGADTAEPGFWDNPSDYVVESTARAVVYNIGSKLDMASKRRVGDAFRANLAARGYDSLMYSYDDGTFALVPMESGQLQFRGTDPRSRSQVDNLVTDWYKRNEELRNRLDDQVAKHEQDVADIGEAVVRANGSAREAWRFHQQNQARIKQLERGVAREWDAISRERSPKVLEELELRGRVAQAYDEAARIEREDMATNLEAMFNAVDDYERQTAQTAAEAAEARVMERRLSAAYDKAQADLVAQNRRALTVEEAVKAFDDNFEPKFKRALEEGFAALNSRSQGPEWMVNALTEVTRLYPENGGLRGVLRAFDYVTDLFKTYAVLTPGFNFRNFGGGVWNNWLAGIDQGAYRQYLRARHLYTKGGREAVARELGDELAGFIDEIDQAGLLTGGQTSELVAAVGVSTMDRGPRGLLAGGHNVGVRSNVLTKANMKAMGHVENTLRGSLALDTMLKGGTIDDAIDRVFKYHFDYDDLGAFESSVMRRVFPFYTWMRKNFMLQLESLITQPQKFNRVLLFNKNMQMGQDQEPVVPDYFYEQMAIALPWEFNGGRMYMTPDLPYLDLNLMSNPREVLSAVNPWLKVPAELATGRQFFSNIPFSGDYGEAPGSWQSIPGLMQGLQLLGRARRGQGGEWYMRDYDSYLVEQFFPLWGRSRRLLPSEERYQQRLLTSWLSVIFGVSLRTNTDKEIEGQIRHEMENVNGLYEDLVNLGYVLRPGDLDVLGQLEEERRTGRQVRGTWGVDESGEPLDGPEPTEMEQIRQAVEGGALSVSEVYDEMPEIAESLYG